jgi:hypothetical protein
MDVLYLVKEWQPIERQMAFQRATVLLSLYVCHHIPYGNGKAAVNPGRYSIQGARLSRLEDKEAYDPLQPGGPALRM